MIKKLEEIKNVISEAKAILIMAGAGMGVDSGLPDFRGKKGFWKEYPKAEELKLGFESLANPYWFAVNPAFAWAFYGHRYNLYKKTSPHEGFRMILELTKAKDDNYFIFTSNVDGQFQKAGFNSEKIFECHGSIHHFQCSENCNKKIWKSKYNEFEIDMKKFEASDIPLCPSCNNIARPNILMFDDLRWNSQRSDKQEAKFNTWIKKFRKKDNKLVIFEIGAGTEISTLRYRSEYMTKRFKDNITLIRINPRDFGIEEDIGYSVPYNAVNGLEKILS